MLMNFEICMPWEKMKKGQCTTKLHTLNNVLNVAPKFLCSSVLLKRR